MGEQNDKKLKIVSIVLGVLLAAGVAAVAVAGFGPLGSTANAADAEAKTETLTVAMPQESETSTKTEISIGTAQATGTTDKKDDTKDSSKKSTSASSSKKSSSSTSSKSSTSDKKASSSNSSASKPAEQQPAESDPPAQQPSQETTPDNNDETDVLSQEYIFSDSDSRLLTDADIVGMSAKELNYARNEIYARHGRIFDAAELVDHFNSRSWYEGTLSAEDFDESILSDTEKQNIAFLEDAENALEPGGYQPQ